VEFDTSVGLASVELLVAEVLPSLRPEVEAELAVVKEPPFPRQPPSPRLRMSALMPARRGPDDREGERSISTKEPER